MERKGFKGKMLIIEFDKRLGFMNRIKFEPKDETRSKLAYFIRFLDKLVGYENTYYDRC